MIDIILASIKGEVKVHMDLPCPFTDDIFRLWFVEQFEKPKNKRNQSSK